MEPRKRGERDDDDFPPIPLRLLERLEELFPDRMQYPDVDVGTSFQAGFQLGIAAGRLELVRFIRNEFDAQQSEDTRIV